MADRIVHIAGFPVRVGTKRRQICAWCGKSLIDLDVNLIAVPEGQSPEPHFWPTGELVDVATGGGFTQQTLVPHKDGDPLPARACAAPPSKLRVVRGA